MFSKTTNLNITVRWPIIILIILLNSHVVLAGSISNEIKSYITNIKKVAIEFKQEDSSGQVAEGMLIIDKPYKFRCNYYEPFPIVIVGNKNYVSVYDYEMEHLSRIKSVENIFNFLLVDNINFDNQFEIISAKEQNTKYIVKLKRADLNKISEISFDKKSKHIKSMKIFEENNTITLKFAKTQQLKSADRSLFIMKDPDVFGKPERWNKTDLRKRLKYN